MDKKDAISELLQARAEGRPIVPFIAAGFSAGSGFPLIDDLRTYLLKVKFFIKYGIYMVKWPILASSQPFSYIILGIEYSKSWKLRGHAIS